MRDIIIRDLSKAIDPKVVASLVKAYEQLVSAYRRADLDRCLMSAGLFVEHTLRAVEFIRTGKAPPEIKSAAATVKDIETDKGLPEPLRYLIPRVAYAMIYEVRSKRGAVHVKEIDPRHIDASLAISAASWVIAEFLRLYHSGDEGAVAKAMEFLMRNHTPLVEMFGDERVVTRKVGCDIELLLLISGAPDRGLDRKALGQGSKYQSPRVTEAIKRLDAARFVHQTKDGKFRITGPGEQFLAERLAADGMIVAPTPNGA